MLGRVSSGPVWKGRDLLGLVSCGPDWFGWVRLGEDFMINLPLKVRWISL